jgi:FkbM family methyltransferase
MKMKSLGKLIVPASMIRLVLPILLKVKAKKLGLDIRVRSDFIDIIRGFDVVRISSGHAVYLQDIINEFQYYFDAVIPFKESNKNIVDYSTPRYHDVVGFDAFPILFPSLSEPVITATQYLEFANLAEGATVLDLGAYSGLTSIIFSEAVGKTGTVIAVDADQRNIECIKRNFSNYKKYFDKNIFLIEGAVWEHNNGLEFSCEGNMGSSAASIVGNKRGSVIKVPSFTLSSIADKFNLQRVDFMKVDVEGAENVIFEDKAFFKKFSPRIIMETHVVDDIITTEKCICDLKAYGYSCKQIIQEGSAAPLLECTPPIPSSVHQHSAIVG